MLIVYNPGAPDTARGTLFGGTLMVKMVSAGHLLTVDVVETQIISKPRKPVIQRAVMRVIFRQKKYFEPEIVRVTVRYFGIVPGQ